MSLVTYILTYGASLLGLALVAAYIFFTRKHDHWKKKGVKHLKPLPFVGNLKDVALARKCIGEVAKEIYDQHKKEPYIGIYAFDEPLLQIHDLNLIKATLVKDFQYFVDRSATVDKKRDPLAAKGLFGLKGERWKHSRNALTPSFTSGKMKRMFEIVTECSKFLMEIMEKEVGNGQPVAVYEVAARYTTDVIASCAFGIQGNTLADPKAEFRRILRLAFEFSPKRAVVMAIAFLAPALLEVFPMKVLDPEVDDFVRNIISSTIKEREARKIKRNDLLDSLIELKNSGRIATEDDKETQKTANKIVLEEEDVAAHSMAFLTAGFETSATTISYILYELALHGDVQQKLREEIQEALAENDDQLSYETLHGLKYLDMVMQETLRKYPPLPFLDRASNQAYTLPGTKLTLPKGARIMVPLYGIQMDPDLFPNPKHFDPERFSEENKKKIANYSHMPFGEGPRSCAGLRFALMQTKTAVARIVSKYTVQPCSGTHKEIAFNAKTFLLQPKTPIMLSFRPL